MASNLVTGLGGPAGFGEHALDVGDDNSSGFIDLRQIFPRGINVFGVVYQGLFVNNNGSVSFGDPVGGVGASVLAAGSRPIIAPFLADIDTRGGAIAPSPGGTSTGANRVWYDLDSSAQTITVTWDDVGRFAAQTDAANAFQLSLTAAPFGVPGEDFDIAFRYEAIDWSTSTSERIGHATISSGNGVNVLHLPGSGTEAGLLALDEGSNVGNPGRYVFRSRAGQIEPEFSVGQVRIVEGTGSAPRMVAITIQRSAPSGIGTSVSYATEADTALPYQDFLPRSGTAFFDPGMTATTILVPLVQDSIPEGSEFFSIRLSNPNGGTLQAPVTSFEIEDDDAPVTSLSVVAAPTRESAGAVVFTATLSAPQAESIVATYGTFSDEATAGVDFVSSTGSITFAPGATTASFSIPLVSDSVLEPNETFGVLVSAAVILREGEGTATILDDDGFSVSGVVVQESKGGAFASFTVSLGSPLAAPATVSFTTVGGTAQPSQDYTPVSGTLTFAPGTTSQAVKVTILDNDIGEQTEQFAFVLTSSSDNTGILVGKATALIIDDDGISVADASVTETNGSTFVDVEITLPRPSLAFTQVDWATASGTAGANDFDANASGTAFFSPGDTSRTITIEVKGDKAAEGDETFRVLLSNPVGNTITDGSGTVTIIDDEALPLIVDIADQEAIDAAGGDVPVAMTVFLNRIHSEPVSVDVALFENGATKGVDYIDAPGTVTIPAGQISTTFEVTLLRATAPEASENITVGISNPTGGAVLAVPEGVPSASANLGVIGYATLFDLFLPAISDAREGEFAAAPPTYTLSRRGDISAEQVVGWAADISLGLPAIDKSDLVATAGTVTFAPGQETVSIPVLVVDDTAFEPNESFMLRLVDLPAGSAIGIEPITGVNIRNDDTAISIFAPGSPYLGLEGGGGPISAPNFRVEIDGDRSLARTVTWTITGSGANPADAADFKAMTGTLSIPAGQDQVTLVIPVQDDKVIEPREGYTVTLSNPGKGATFAQASASSFITNDDTSGTLSIAKASQAEGSSGGTTTYAFTVTIDPAPPRNFNDFFTWKVTGGGRPNTLPADPADFGASKFPSGGLLFGPSQATFAIDVPVAADTAVELNESFTLTLFNSDGIAISTATAAILNDDALLSIAAISANKPEGSGLAPTPYSFTIARSGNLAQTSTVTWSAAGIAGTGTTPAGAADFAGGVLPSGSVTFAPGETSKPVTVNIAADRTLEPNERFAVTLASPSPGTTLGQGSATGIIQNDDAAGSGTLLVQALNAVQNEGHLGSTPYHFAVTRTGDTTKPAAADWRVSGIAQSGTVAALASDFVGGVLPTGTVTFLAGQTSQKVTVNVAGDTLIELNETFALTFSNQSSGVVLGSAPTVARIMNDDALGSGTLSIAAPVNRAEGRSGTTPFTFTVTRSGDTTRGASAAWSTRGVAIGGTVAANAADFVGGVLPSGVVNFLPGKTSQTITINVAGDLAVELNEGFGVTLAAPGPGVALGTADATVAILNDDTVGTGTLSIAAAAAAKPEGNSGTTPFTFTVTRSGDSKGTASAVWTVDGGTVIGQAKATANDFAGGAFPSGLVTFAAGQTSQTVTVNVAGDVAIEVAEGFAVTLSAPQVGVALGAASANGVIQNDDELVLGSLSIATAVTNRPEGASGTTPFTFTVTRSGEPVGTATVKWSVAGASVSGTVPATASDFAGGAFPSGTLTFAPAQTSQTVTVNVAGDIAGELNEAFAVTLSGQTNGVSLGTASADGVILNDDFVSSAANQALVGTAGPDVFLLGGGIDTVLGKGGIDSFLFRPSALGDGATNATVLNDFSASGGERLDLSAIDAIAGGGTANDAFVFIGTAAFTGPGQIRWQDNGATRTVFGNVDANTTPELTIILSAAGPVEASWFVL